MVVKEFYKTREDGVNLFRTYSDNGFMIQKVGTDEVYEEAVDVEGVPFKYVETDEKIEENEE
jgi:hypothetical protein